MEIQSNTAEEELRALSYDQLMSKLSELWMYFSKEPLNGNEVVGRMIRAFIERVETRATSGKRRKLSIVWKFNEKLLHQPIHELLQAVLSCIDWATITSDLCAAMQKRTHHSDDRSTRLRQDNAIPAHSDHIA